MFKTIKYENINRIKKRIDCPPDSQKNNFFHQKPFNTVLKNKNFQSCFKHQNKRPVSLSLKDRYTPLESRASILKETDSASKSNVRLRSKKTIPNCSNKKSNKRVTFDFTTWEPKDLNLIENKRNSTGILKKVKNKTQKFSYFYKNSLSRSKTRVFTV